MESHIDFMIEQERDRERGRGRTIDRAVEEDRKGGRGVVGGGVRGHQED